MSPWTLTLFSFIISGILYAYMINWTFSAGVLFLLCVHELGHWYLIKKLHLLAKPPIFIPFFGAIIIMDMENITKREEAMFAIAGPFAGGIASLMLLLASLALAEEQPNALFQLGLIGMAFNLFNLIPLRPFDGGRVTQIISGWFSWIGFFILSILFLLTKNIVFIFIGYVAIREAYYRKINKDTVDKDENVLFTTRIAWLAGYISLVGLFAFIIYYFLGENFSFLKIKK